MGTLPQTGRRLRTASLVFVALMLFTSALRAQIGNDNPTGPAGAFMAAELVKDLTSAARAEAESEANALPSDPGPLSNPD